MQTRKRWTFGSSLNISYFTDTEKTYLWRGYTALGVEFPKKVIVIGKEVLALMFKSREALNEAFDNNTYVVFKHAVDYSVNKICYLNIGFGTEQPPKLKLYVRSLDLCDKRQSLAISGFEFAQITKTKIGSILTEMKVS
jgi:hypothetical protein